MEPETLHPIAMTVDQAAILRYAALTNDFNPLHVDPAFAATTEMGGVIAHGTLSLGLIWQSLVATLGANAVLDLDLRIKFVRPVRVGDRVEASGERVAAGEGYTVRVRKQDGTDIIVGTALKRAAR